MQRRSKQVGPTVDRFDQIPTPRNDAQRAAEALIRTADWMFLAGPAGSGKTHQAVKMAVRATQDETYFGFRPRKIILSRPTVEAGPHRLGYLPGDISEKLAPWLMPIHDVLSKITTVKADVFMKSVFDVVTFQHMRGRSQPLDAYVLTPTGYRPMGDLGVGDEVIGSSGGSVRVLGVYPQGELDVYRVEFTDGAAVECSGDHLWTTTTRDDRDRSFGSRVITTEQIAATLRRGPAYNHQIPLCRPVVFAARPLVGIDPYVLGALLGDGNLHRKASVTITSTDAEIVAEVGVGLPAGVLVRPAKPRAGFTDQYRLSGDRSQPNGLRVELDRLGLLGTKAENKFVPDDAKFGTPEYRLGVLQGLMDTDGCCWVQPGKRKSRVQFYSISERLARDVAFLVNSLGGTAALRRREYGDRDTHTFRGREIRHNHDMWVVEVRMSQNPFRLPRKADLFEPAVPIRAVKSVTLVGRKPCQCIRVDAVDSLYLTEHCVVTHNTFDDCVVIVDEAQNCTWDLLELAYCRLGQRAKMIFTGDHTQSDLPPHQQAFPWFMDALHGLESTACIYFDESMIVRNSRLADGLKRIRAGKDRWHKEKPPEPLTPAHRRH